MQTLLKRATILLTAIAVIVAGRDIYAQPIVEPFLISGRLGEGEQCQAAYLLENPMDDQVRFGLGVLQTMQGVEALMQALYTHGLDPLWARQAPFLRLPVPENPAPTPLTYEASRKILIDFSTQLGVAEQTLAQVDSPDVLLPLRLALVRLDFNGDGRAAEDEMLSAILARVMGRGGRLTPDDLNRANASVIHFDKGDVHWLRGYCHLLSAICEIVLAYDGETLFDQTATLFFPTAKAQNLIPGDGSGDEMIRDIADGIAFIHLVRLPLVEPERLRTAREHLLEVVAQSRESWQAIRAERDDVREWVPAPWQTDVVIGRINAEQVDAWHNFLDEFEALLRGDKLAPFWRSSRGINVRRVFLEPSAFDLVLWVQGSGVAQYLEEGELSSPDFWRRLNRNFDGMFMGFAIWIN